MNKRHVLSEETQAKCMRTKVIEMARSTNMDQFIQEVIDTGEVCLSELACISTILNMCIRVTATDQARFPLYKVLQLHETIYIFVYIYTQLYI